MVLFNKPYGVLCQFSPDGSGKPTLADWLDVPGFYPAGRLDHDSEGLVVLTADGSLQARIADPRRKLPKTYLAQVEGVPDERAARGAAGRRRPAGRPDGAAGARVVPAPADLWPRNPPIRVRQAIPTALAGTGADRGTQPAGAADDGGRRPADAAADPSGGRPLVDRRAGRRGTRGTVAVDRVLPFGPVR